MKKAQKFTLELEDDVLEYEDMALLFFHTPVPGYVFVDDLNRLYRLELSRNPDIELRELRWPLYRYYDPIAKLTYLVIERPSESGGTAPHWKERHKLLIIQGERAELRAESIRTEFEAAPAIKNMDSLLEEERIKILEAYQEELIVVSRMELGGTPTVSFPKKATKERAELETLVYDLLDYLDIHGRQA